MKTHFKTWLLALVALSVLSGLPISAAQAHGEKALEPFIRMRTIQWYDVQWSTQTFKVNDEVSVSGKFHVAEDWPVSVPKPEASFLNISTPGPVLIRTERYLNGKPWTNSVALQPGGDYDFKVVMKGRLPGRYHIHPFFNLKDAGQVMGPGVWLEIGGNPGDFSNTIKTINGEMIDMESFGFANGVFWHLFWGALAAAWLLWWVRRPLFISRYRMLDAGLEHELITPQDKWIAKVVLVSVPVLVLVLNAVTANRYPDAIPLQAGLDQILPLPAQVNAGTVNVDTLKAEYNIAQRAMVLQVKVDNRSQGAVRIGEFASSNVHFLNADVANSGYNPGKDDVSNNGLSLDNASPIEPGEQRTVTIEVRDAAWESERLDGLIRDADSRLGGLLFLYDDMLGKRYISSISAAVIPKFN
ncbi:bacterial ammonia monooxygenase, subunit AmoB [Methylomonas methanica]|uniref:Methane monooxygenase/ammonia monooxygenase subunit B n=1 Tax=Methylomonas methanica TaxID=421 RepID=A0A177MR14_METMH|nr:bacterial ammonia monooxygenase, subunit AmoB [Methylomonas methanica]OAI07299.1 methane monooxygenase/ammonia monooxygenase subunit B [Methylomonas methanica]